MGYQLTSSAQAPEKGIFPTLSLLCRHMSECPVPHSPMILARISPVLAHTLGGTVIAELEFQMFGIEESG